MTKIANAEGKIWLAIQGRLDLWTETAKMYPGQIFQPSASSPFLIVQDIGLDTSDRAIRQDCGESLRGLLNVSVMTPITWNWAQHKGLCGRLSDFLADSGVMAYQDANVSFSQRPRVNGSPRLEEKHNRVEVQAEYRCWG